MLRNNVLNWFKTFRCETNAHVASNSSAMNHYHVAHLCPRKAIKQLQFCMCHLSTLFDQEKRFKYC